MGTTGRARSERRRRVVRQLKALGSIALALVGGTFLACQRRGASDDSAPGDRLGTASDSAPSATSAAPADSAASPAAAPAASGAPSAESTASSPAASAASRPSKSPTVDRGEHRKGMPVRDNLLE
jgi:hypothetical protein